ncbi:MAG: hypothetical protein RO257_06525 [Candidatus Kapabacteria bacterium]|nr:hypothetical protein [Candidatus Kapabacteria bacterium]
MEAVLLKSNSVSNMELVVNLARKLGIEIAKINGTDDNLNKDSISNKSIHNFLNSQGIWKNRNIDAMQLRKEAWKIQG